MRPGHRDDMASPQQATGALAAPGRAAGPAALAARERPEQRGFVFGVARLRGRHRLRQHTLHRVGAKSRPIFRPLMQGFSLKTLGRVVRFGPALSELTEVRFPSRKTEMLTATHTGLLSAASVAPGEREAPQLAATSRWRSDDHGRI